MPASTLGAGSVSEVLPKPTLARRGIEWLDTITSIPDQESGWITPAVARGLTLAIGRRPQLLYSTAPPWSAQVVATRLATLLRCPWVADFRDPWARAPWRDNLAPRIRAASERLERSVVHRADAVVFNTQRLRAEFATAYGPDIAAKLHVVPNGCDTGAFGSLPRPLAPGTFVLLHAGSLYGARSPVVLLRALSNLINTGTFSRSSIRLRLLGSPRLPADTTAAIHALGLADCVELLPRVSRDDSYREMASAGALLLLQQGHALSVPAKTYEYLAAGRPILAITDDGETADVIRAAGVGVVAASENQAEIEAALVQVISMGARGVKRAPASQFDGSVRARELTALLTQVMARKTSGSPAASSTYEETDRA